MGSFDQITKSLPDAQVITGIGDQAVYSPSGGVVVGFLGGKLFGTQVVKGGKPAGKDDVLALATAFVKRLP